MTTKAERKAAKRAEREAQAQRVASNPAEAILGTPVDEGEDNTELEEMVEKVAEAGEPVEETSESQEETEKPEETEEPKQEATSLEEMVKNLSPELRDAALEQIGKLRAQAEKNEANKRYAEFDKACKDEKTGLASIVAEIAKKHGVDLSGRKLVISYPDGKFDYTNSAIGKKGESNGRSGFPSGWGEAEEVGKNGKVIQKQSSPSKLAEKMGLQVEGMRDMKDVFENPKQRGSKADLPKTFRVEAVRGEYFRVVHTK